MNAFDTNTEIAWCPGCGNFDILMGIKETLTELKMKSEDTVLVSGIGQAAKTPHYVKVNGFNGLHGRALPPAQAIRLTNPKLKVIVNSGDGDNYAEGGNHFLHAVRRNIDMVHVVNDNQIYGLTKGQGSPTTAVGQKTSLQINGVIDNPLNPLLIAMSAGATFVARAFSGDKEHFKSLFKAALAHKGYALIDVFQPCISFNKVNTFMWYKSRVYHLGPDYDPTNRQEAFRCVEEFGDKIPIGIIYKEEGRQTYEERHEVLKTGKSILERKWDAGDVTSFFEEFK